MKISDLLINYSPTANYEGFITNDDWVLAVDLTSGTNTDIDDYTVAQMGVAGLDAQLNPITVDQQYIRAGQSTTKTGTQRTFAITGDRYVGDDFQDYCFSHIIKYGVGQSVMVPYVYFNVKNGFGEKGRVSIIVNSDGSGNAGENSGISIDLKKAGSLPTYYTYVQTKLVAIQVTSAAGATTGTTKIMVMPVKETGNSYQYKTSATDFTLPERGDSTLTGYQAWDGLVDITATNGHTIAIVECNSDGQAIKGGKTIVVSNLS